MRKTLIATAVLLAAAAAQAQSPAVGSTTNNAVYQAGATTFPDGHFHGPNGAPGVGFAGAGGYIISLQSIDPYTGNGTVSVPGTTVVFNRYQLLGYTHAGPGGTITANFNWARVAGAKSQASAADPIVDRRVYFGLVTDTVGTTPVHDAFYTGDPTDRVVPTVTTNYAAVAFLAVPTTSASAPEVLTGNLRYDTAAGTLKTATTAGAASTLTNGSYSLGIDTAVSGATFSGTSSFSGPGAASGSGNASGQFFGSGNGSAVAGIAKGSSGAAYVASFGGIKN